ncbi:hypothetical protein LNKW23_07070 [Paralimibaculum aggregatum]|uniref:Uncharacterized protein n=1 Tax=Paralimibaculum aggregatum TaxID=3036245 RepID=A0ABQ6LLF6_9RHOB|nr:hypothetical protein LNKW23_07070 [Limibaculum sp. NKW23]
MPPVSSSFRLPPHPVSGRPFRRQGRGAGTWQPWCAEGDRQPHPTGSPKPVRGGRERQHAGRGPAPAPVDGRTEPGTRPSATGTRSRRASRAADGATQADGIAVRPMCRSGPEPAGVGSLRIAGQARRTVCSRNETTATLAGNRQQGRARGGCVRRRAEGRRRGHPTGSPAPGWAHGDLQRGGRQRCISVCRDRNGASAFWAGDRHPNGEGRR